ncbi:EmrB/QacA subfamily drug resistance transporter [Rhodococcus sp. SMB37]|jgi:EmrB/QacA subfamily drug resistance transporter|uniref:MFS transporter n=1 Tax=Rhodococcus sp. SMB37 TaxID=2512213 RepID=UPI0006D29E61|nr:MFS transporter [Rhodococcus sp. SMB37]TCN46771.1 EmrB/QacA subfamily drug resistance transporter [Rhodococcus sp. SMB37]
MTRAQLWLLVVACSSVSAVIAAMAALNTALPDIAVETGATQSQLTWVVDGYTLALAALLLPCGALGDRFGRRGVLVIGLVIFGLGSALPLITDGPTWLIASRGIAGVGAALVMPATLSLITTGFSPEHRARAIGIWAGVAGSGAVVGMIVSGVILEYASWKLIFGGFAVASLVMVVMSLTIPSSRAENPGRFDIGGSILAIAAIGLFVLGVMEGPHRGWLDPVTLGCIAVGVAAAVGFVFAELRAAEPLLDMRLFGNREFGVGAAALNLQFLAGFGLFFLMVQYLQLVQGYSPLMSSVAMTPIFVLVMIMSVAVPLMLRWIGLRILMSVGLALIGVSLIFLGMLDADSSYLDVALAMLVTGVGVGFCTAPGTHAIVSNTPEDQQGVASAVNDATREIGAAIGVAAAGSVLAAAYGNRIAPTAEMLPEPARGAVEDSLAAALQVAEQAGPQGEQLAALAQDAFLEGMQQASFALAAVLLVGAVGAAFWAPPRS